MNTITFENTKYPAFQATGNAARFALPFAEEIIGFGKVGYDIGCMKKEWSYPNSILIDVNIEDPWDAYSLPSTPVDYIFSSHCLEHLPDWVGALDYWNTKLKIGGVLFLYLPHKSQKYWNPWNNRKHYHMFSSSQFIKYFKSKQTIWKNTFVTKGHDLNNSFYCVAEKCG